MRNTCWYVGCLAVAAGALGEGCGQVQAQPLVPAAPVERPHAVASGPAHPTVQAPTLPLANVPAPIRHQVRAVVEQPTLSGCGPADEFSGRLALYEWLLDHPDRVAKAWRQLGAPCLNIVRRPDGRFSWSDPQGGDVTWQTVVSNGQMHVWYAEGRVRPGALFPALPVRVVVVMHHAENQDLLGRMQVRHQADMYLQTDSAAAALVLRLIGPSAPHLTEQALGQMELFFSAMSGYLQRHPERVESLLATQSAERGMRSAP